MREAIDFSRRIPLLDEVDVVVIGGGPSGCAASVAAARDGKRVALLECTGMLGGAGTQSGVAIFMIAGNFTGFYRELVRAVRPDFETSVDDPTAYKVQFDPHVLRLVLNEKVHDAGVRIYYHADFVGSADDAGCDGRTVVFNTVEGLRAIRASIVIDATGNGRAAIDAGAGYTTGDEGNGLQPMSLVFQMQKGDSDIPFRLPDFCERYADVSDLPQGRVLKWEKGPKGTMLVNMTRVQGNGSTIDDLNRAEQESLRQVFSVASYLHDHGYSDYALSSVGPQVGVRESNQIVGAYTLTEQDLLEGRRFDDVVAQSNYNIDIHGATGSDGTEERPIERYDIPYRVMVPRGIDDMLVTGRAISASHVAISSARIMPTCYALGQAAGLAASIAIDQHCQPASIDIDELHGRLSSQGVAFDD